jgi:hypothetical protein
MNALSCLPFNMRCVGSPRTQLEVVGHWSSAGVLAGNGVWLGFHRCFPEKLQLGGLFFIKNFYVPPFSEEVVQCGHDAAHDETDSDADGDAVRAQPPGKEGDEGKTQHPERDEVQRENLEHGSTRADDTV